MSSFLPPSLDRVFGAVVVARKLSQNGPGKHSLRRELLCNTQLSTSTTRDTFSSNNRQVSPAIACYRAPFRRSLDFSVVALHAGPYIADERSTKPILTSVVCWRETCSTSSSRPRNSSKPRRRMRCPETTISGGGVVCRRKYHQAKAMAPHTPSTTTKPSLAWHTASWCSA